MKNKRVLVFGMVLVLLALVAGVAFAAKGNVNGVIWVVIEGKSSRLGNSQRGKWYMEVYNSNNYRVIVNVTGVSGSGDVWFNAGETKHFEAGPSGCVVSVKKAPR
jgi:hypothetical protein